MAATNLADADLERQAFAMACKALPASLAPAAREAKLPTIASKILERLKFQRCAVAASLCPAVKLIVPTVGAPGVVTSNCTTPRQPPPTPDERISQLKVEGAELYGDELWFVDPAARSRLQKSIADAHKDQKILIACPSEEIRRICPEISGRALGAGAVLRLGGANVGGFCESDIAYAYRQLSRVLHPDKNPDLPDAPSAFRRLAEASDALRKSLEAQRAALAALTAVLGGEFPMTTGTRDRPQEPLFAEAMRLLHALCGLSGVGGVSHIPEAKHRATVAFVMSPAYRSVRSAPALLAEWMERDLLLEVFKGSALRSAFDCAPRRLRAQFVCLLVRALNAEAARCSGCVRPGWNEVLQNFPEIGPWRELRERLRRRALDDEDSVSDRGRSRSRSRGRGETPSKWGRKWRTAILAILPSALDAAVPPTDPEVRKLATVLWKDIVRWAQSCSEHALERGLALFRAKPGLIGRGLEDDASPAEWAFIPATDILLAVAEDVVGVTFEGIFADNPAGHQRLSLADCYRKAGGAKAGAPTAPPVQAASGPTPPMPALEDKAPAESGTLLSLLGSGARR